MQAIITKYLPPTNTKPSRIKASCERGSCIVSYDSGATQEVAHCYAANHLCEKFVNEDAAKYGSNPLSNPWARKRVSGGFKDSYFHVFTT